jgi:DNA-binding NarL/FixJ family response regulator
VNFNAQVPDAVKAVAIDFLSEPVGSKRLYAAEWRFTSLTVCKRQMLTGVIAGRLNEQIAAILGSGENTVQVHRGRVMDKMAVHTVIEPAHLAMSIGNAIKLVIDSTLNRRSRGTHQEECA